MVSLGIDVFYLETIIDFAFFSRLDDDSFPHSSIRSFLVCGVNKKTEKRDLPISADIFVLRKLSWKTVLISVPRQNEGDKKCRRSVFERVS
jgi:hypothetical protein